MTSPEYQAPTWVNEDDPDFIEGVSPDLGAGYLNQLSGAVEDHGQRLGAIAPVVTYLNANSVTQDAGDNRWILQDNAVGFAPAEATTTALNAKANTSSLAALATSGKLADATDVTTTGAAVGQIPAVTQVDGAGKATGFGLVERAPAAITTQAQAWSTTDDLTTAALTASTPPPFTELAQIGVGDLVVRSGDRHQEILGFGAALTDASAFNMLVRMNASQRAALLEELFVTNGLSMVRIGLGATDFSSVPAYSFDDMPTGQTDPSLVNFSIDQDTRRIIPVLREILALNPRVRIIASVWFPPQWMLTTPANGWVMGMSVATAQNTTYVNYLVRAVRAYRDLGIPLWALNPANEATGGTFKMGVSQHWAVIPALRTALDAAGLDTRIIAHDDHWTFSDTALNILSDANTRAAVEGVAWHGYLGGPNAQSIVHRTYPTLSHHITEYRSLQAESLDETMASMASLAILGVRNWANSVTLWNMALDQNGGPNLGISGRRGIVTINSSTGAVTRNPEFYVLSHLARFIKPGARRCGVSNYGQPYVATSQWPGDLIATAAVNPDGSVVLVAFNDTEAPKTVQVVDADSRQAFPVTFAPSELRTFLWGTTEQATPPGTPVTPAAPAAPVLTATGGAGQTVLSWTAPTSGAQVSSYTITRDGTIVATLTPDKLAHVDFAAAGTYTYVVIANSYAGSTGSASRSATTTAATAPSAPVLSINSTAGIALSWTAPSANGAAITSYVVSRGSASGSLTTLATLSKGTLAYTDVSAPGGTLYYTVKAVNSVGTGPASNEVSGAVAAPFTDTVQTYIGSTGGEAAPTWQHTVTPGTANGMLLVVLGMAAVSSYTNPTAAGVTYAGQAMTQLARAADSNVAKNLEVWALKNPPTGGGAVAVTMTSGSTTGQAQFACHSVSLGSVNQTTPYGAAVVATTAAVPATSLAATTDGLAGDTVFSAIMVRSTTKPTPGTGQTERSAALVGSNNYTATSTKPGAAGSVTSSYSWSVSDRANVIAVPLHNA